MYKRQGERAGNCSLEEVVMNLKTRQDYFNVETRIKTEEIYITSKLVSELTGISVQRNKAIVGMNAFAHEAGVHQDGVIKERTTYEIMRPEDIGWKGENIVIGKHSGKNAVECVLKENGYSIKKDKIIEVTQKVKDFADKNKQITRQDILEIVKEN